jgi:hypothetical protein
MLLTVITPTTGKRSLFKLMQSIDLQNDGDIFHLLLWDDKRDSPLPPDSFNGANRFSMVAPPESGRNVNAPGSLLRALGMIAARTPWVTFADDDVWWEPDHYATLRRLMPAHNWITTFRKIWASEAAYIGVDRYESVGDDPTRVVPYEMCDGNTMTFKREYGVEAAPQYRETQDYNDDRLMYAFLKGKAGPRGKTGTATVNQICPQRAVNFFTAHCKSASEVPVS